jgi:hypothetical protein
MLSSGFPRGDASRLSCAEVVSATDGQRDHVSLAQSNTARRVRMCEPRRDASAKRFGVTRELLRNRATSES